MGIPAKHFKESLSPENDFASVTQESCNQQKEMNNLHLKDGSLQQTKPAEFGQVCRNLKKMLTSGGSEAQTRRELKTLFLQILSSYPDDVTVLLCFLRDQITSPTLAGIELIPSSIIVKALAEACGKTIDGVHQYIAQASSLSPSIDVRLSEFAGARRRRSCCREVANNSVHVVQTCSSAPQSGAGAAKRNLLARWEATAMIWSLTSCVRGTRLAEACQLG
eukprot:757279-Hanusia_phi.AAC.7